MKTKNIVLLLLLLSSNLYLYSQTPKKWSLEECIQYAIAHNIDVKRITLQKESAAVELNTAKMSRLPDLYAGATQRWNFGRSNNTPTGMYENQTISNSNIYAASSTPLFNGFKTTNQVAYNKLQLEAVAHSLEKAKEDLSLNVTGYYLQVLLNKEILKIKEEELALSQSQLKKTEVLVEVGKVPMSQLFDIKAQIAKDEATVTEKNNKLQLSLLDLMQILELENASSFDIADPETGSAIEISMTGILSPETIYNNAVTFKPQIKEQELLVKGAKKWLRVTQADHYPSLSLELGYNNSYFYNYTLEGRSMINTTTSAPYIWRNTSFTEQLKNNGGEYIGLNLGIPVFNRFATKNKVKSARLGIQNQQLILEESKKKLYKEIQIAHSNAIAAQTQYSASVKAVDASRESFKYAEERYEIGKSTVFEFNDAKTRLIQSLSEQIQAKYDYIFRTKILDFYNGMGL